MLGAGNKRAFAAAMNIKCLAGLLSSAPARAPQANSACGQSVPKKQLEFLERMHAWSMIGTKPMHAAKARRFFTVLHDKIVRMWLQDERLNASDFMRMVKEEYLVC